MQHSIAQTMSPCSLDWSFEEPNPTYNLFCNVFPGSVDPFLLGVFLIVLFANIKEWLKCLAFYSYVPLCSRTCSSSSNNCIAAAFANATMTQMYTLATKTLSLKEKVVRNDYLSWVDSRNKNNHFIIILTHQTTWIRHCKCCCPTLITAH